MKKRIYAIEEYIDEDNKFVLKRSNDRFNSLELLGILELIQLDIFQQMKGNIKHDIIKRNIIED